MLLKHHWSISENQNSDTMNSSSYVLPVPKRQILHTSNLKEFSDDNFKINENGGKFSEIACYWQFFFFPQGFQKNCSADTFKQGLFWVRVNSTEQQNVIDLTAEFGSICRWQL